MLFNKIAEMIRTVKSNGQYDSAASYLRLAYDGKYINYEQYSILHKYLITSGLKRIVDRIPDPQQGKYKMYNYLISFIWSDYGNNTRYASVYVAVEENYITENNIRIAATRNAVPLSAVVLSVSYLGEYD